MRTLVTILGAGLALAGCFSPDYQSGHLQCTTAGECPPGFHCAAQHCYRDGEEPDLAISETPDLGGEVADLTSNDDLTTSPDLSPPPPLLYPPAAVFISSGGGAGVKNGNQLNMSMPGSSAAGLSVAPSGASINFGFFSNDSVE